jgi:hypothetical protein
MGSKLWKIYGIWDGIWCGIYIWDFFRSHGNVRGTEYYWMNYNDLSIWDWGFHSHGDTPIVSHLWERSYGLTRVCFCKGRKGGQLPLLDAHNESRSVTLFWELARCDCFVYPLVN